MDAALAGCDNCGQGYDASAIVCPFCRAPRGVAGIASSARQAEDRLDRVLTEQLLARTDARLDDLLARDLDAPLQLGDLRDALARVDERTDPTVAELEGALTTNAAIALDGITLADLVDPRGGDAKLVRRGLTFLRNQRYDEALEWWSLHREQLDPANERFALLLLLLESFTHRLAGNASRAVDINARIVAHPLYRRMRGLDRK